MKSVILDGFSAEKWTAEGNAEFSINEHYAQIHKESAELARWRCTAVPVRGGAYEFNVSYEADTSPYAMISQYRADGSCIIRLYADNENNGEKHCIFTAEEDCVTIVVELGLKGCGNVKWFAPVLKECEPPKSRKVKIAVTRLNPSKTTEQAMAKLEKAVDEAGSQNPDVIVMGEIINDMGCGLSMQQSAQTEDGEYCSLMREKAKKYNTYIVMNFHEKSGSKIYNTSLLIDRKGNTAGKYRKTHISFNEYEQGITAGSELPVFDTDFGRVGMLICWDMYFPEPARIMAMNGAELLLVSTAGDASFRHVSRALENGIYVAVSGNMYRNLNGCGVEPSKIIAPDGTVIAQTNEDGKSAFAEIDLNEKTKIYWLSAAAAYSVPGNVYMNERRPDLYKDISEAGKE